MSDGVVLLKNFNLKSLEILGISYSKICKEGIKNLIDLNLRNLKSIDLYVIDQSPCKSLYPYIMMSKADSTSASVAAASILAKNYRDKIIEELSDKFPEYKFNEHNGYINKLHVEIVNHLGLIEGIHRKSFSVSGFNKPKQISMMEMINDNSNY